MKYGILHQKFGRLYIFANFQKVCEGDFLNNTNIKTKWLLFLYLDNFTTLIYMQIRVNFRVATL